MEEADFRELSYQLKLVEIFNQRKKPRIPIGRHRAVTLSFVPDHDALQKTRPGKDLPDWRKIRATSILGMNDNVEPPLPGRDRRNPNLPEESEHSAQSDDTDSTKLQVFQILGELGRHRDWPSEADKQNAKRSYQKPNFPWRSTGFAVVFNITSGFASDVCIIYDFQPEDEETGERGEIGPDVRWGFLPDHDDQFAVAKVADSLRDLQWDRDFTIPADSCLRRGPELVPVRQDANGRPLLRTTIFKPQQ